jgi:hypothetical protein
MPALTLQNIMSEATSALGQRLDLTQSQVSLQANLAMFEVVAMLPHTELMVTGTISVDTSSGGTTLPADFGEAVDLYRSSNTMPYDAFGGRLLTLVPAREIDNASEGTATGQPNRYAISANSLLWYPSSKSRDAFTMRYVKIPSDMTNLTDLPSLHTRYHSAVLYKLCENLADRVVDNQRAAYYRNKFLSVMGAIPSPSDVLNRSERTFPAR